MIRSLAPLFFLAVCMACNPNSERTKNQKENEVSEKQTENSTDMRDPLRMSGKDLGQLYRDLYLEKDFEGMLTYTSATVISLHGRQNLKSFLVNADLKDEMQFDHKEEEGEVQVMYYRVGSQIKKLRVVEESDTMRVWPLDVEAGRILE